MWIHQSLAKRQRGSHVTGVGVGFLASHVMWVRALLVHLGDKDDLGYDDMIHAVFIGQEDVRTCVLLAFIISWSL